MSQSHDLAIEIASKLDTLGRIGNSLDEPPDFRTFLKGVQEEFAGFKTNLGALSAAYRSMGGLSEGEPFLVGTLWSGVLAAYEGFIHGLFDRLLRKEGFRVLAERRIHEVGVEDKDAIGRAWFKAVMTPSDIEQLFCRAISDSPNRAADLLSHLFEIPVPKLDESDLQWALQVRAAYLHNSGRVQGKRVEVTPDGLFAFGDETEARVSRFAYGLVGHLQALLGGENGR